MTDIHEVKDFKDRIINDCVGISKALKNMFGVVYKHELNKDRQYLTNEKEIARNALDILTAFVTDTDDQEVVEAYEYLKMICDE